MPKETGALVTEELQKRGIPATWYGYITVITVDGCHVDYGTANGRWEGDNTDEAWNVFEVLESDIPEDSTDVKALADWIACNTRHAPGQTCLRCHTKYARESIDGGRCVVCGTMICAEGGDLT